MRELTPAEEVNIRLAECSTAQKMVSGYLHKLDEFDQRVKGKHRFVVNMNSAGSVEVFHDKDHELWNKLVEQGRRYLQSQLLAAHERVTAANAQYELAASTILPVAR